MTRSEITRRVFVGTITALGLSATEDGWVELFDGHSLEGWRPSENKNCWKVEEGQLVAEGPRSHLFYTGPVHSADFRNFELEVEVLTRPACNSGVYFHTAYQERDFPNKGFEIQIDNTATGDGGYRERKKTGSLYGLRNVYKQLVPDGQWFKIHAAVRGKNVQIRLNGILVVDYTEPVPPVIPDGPEKGRFLDHGTLALQCHNDGSHVRFRSVRVRPLPDDLSTPGGPAPPADEVFKQIINQGRRNIPMADFHTHLKGGLTVDQALANSRRTGIQYGIGRELRQRKSGPRRCGLHSVPGQPERPAMLRRDAGGRARVDPDVLARRGRQVRLHLYRLHDLDGQPRQADAALAPRRSGNYRGPAGVHGHPCRTDCGNPGARAGRYLCKPYIPAGCAGQGL